MTTNPPSTTEMAIQLTKLEKQLSQMRLQAVYQKVHNTFPNQVPMHIRITVSKATEAVHSPHYCHALTSDRLDDAEALVARLTF